MQIVGIRKLYYAASLKQSGPALEAALRPAIDVDLVRSEAGATVDARRMPAEQLGDEEALVVLRAWAASKTAAE